MSKAGICIAMPEEARRLLALLNLSEYCEDFDGARFYDSPDVTVGVGGVGTLAAAMTAMTLISRYGCEVIYNIGSCGSTGPKHPVGQIVSVTSAYKGDVDVTLLGCEPYQLPGMPARLDLPHDAAYPAAVCRSSDRFIGAGDDVERDIIAEMEAFAVAYVCRRAGKECRVYKVVSDMTEKNTDGSQFEGNLDEVAGQLCEHIYHIITR